MRTVGLIIMVAGLIGMWVSTFALIYLQGHLDVLRWSLKWLKWEQDPSPWAPKPPAKAPINWRSLVGYVLIATGVTLVVLTSLVK